MTLRNIFLSFFLSMLLFTAKAEEGLWIPMLLQYYNIDIMQKEGLRLNAEDIYSINQACLKDAVVIFGGGCTGELISKDGLLITNHHCGYSAIQSHSSVEKDYLTNGFWAMSKQEELPNAGLKVTFLVRIEDVTSRVLKNVTDGITEKMRDSLINVNTSIIKTEQSNNTGYKAVIKPFYFGNEYYMFIYQEYTDIRLVGAPPNSIGNYGEDFDNWVWPRHTGDFSIFRIYADKNNQPANYSPDNVPFKSKKFLSISTSGVKEGDFSMIMGYPGTTNEYIIADEVSLMYNTLLPKKVAIRDARLKIMDKYMAANDTIRIMYAAKYRNVSNAWKKWQGVIVGLKSTNALEEKLKVEDNFQEWVKSSPEKTEKYGTILPGLKVLNNLISRFSLVYEYSGESVMATEIFNFAMDCSYLLETSKDLSAEEKRNAIEKFKASTEGFLKNYNRRIDQETFATMLRYYYNDIDKEFHPAFFQQIEKKYKNDFNRYASETFNKTIFTDKKALFALLDQYVSNSDKINKKVLNDPVIMIYREFSNLYYDKVIPVYSDINAKMQILYRIYIQGLREMQSDKVFYPDANFTMRVAYGKIEGYQPADGIFYEYATNLSGVMEKYKSDTVNYAVPPYLIELYSKKDFGRWADKNGEIPVCFAASNHTSGGNSGSPVLNAYGQLIGINFDRNWEGTMSDIYYDVSICRNISVDIRYVLFIIDKYAHAGYLIDEMDLVQ